MGKLKSSLNQLDKDINLYFRIIVKARIRIKLLITTKNESSKKTSDFYCFYIRPLAFDRLFSTI